MKEEQKRKFCVAPMMGYTTPYARKLYRSLSKRAYLFTEMIACNTMLFSKNKDLIIENEFQNPVAIQVGGSDLKDLKKCTKIAKQYNYDEINLNVGCPSKAVQKGSFGACLMQNKKLVRECLESMQGNEIEVSIKCRLGLGNKLNYDYFEEFIDEILKSEIKIVYVHARNALLGGLSPKENRTIPPLNYEFVKKIKSKYTNVSFILNGGINDFNKVENLLTEFDGVMLGRLIQNNPFCLKNVDKHIYNEKNVTNFDESSINNYFEFIKLKKGSDSIFRLLSPILQIFFGIPNSKATKIKIYEYLKEGKIDLIEKKLISFLKENRLIIN